MWAIWKIPDSSKRCISICFPRADIRFTDRREPDSYISVKMKIVPIIYGGGQQKGMRSGTDNVPGIAGLGIGFQNGL